MADVVCIFDSGKFDTDAGSTYVFGGGYVSYTHTDSVTGTDALSAGRLRATLPDTVAGADALSAGRLFATVTDSVSFSDLLSPLTVLKATVTDSVDFDEEVFAHAYEALILYSYLTTDLNLHSKMRG
jgi:hypothetical protein